MHRYLCLDPDLKERKRFRQKADQGGNQADGRSICEEFLRRLQSLHPGVLDCMCEAAIGTTMIFFRQAQERALKEARYVSASKDATCIARYRRGLLARRVYGRLRDARKLLLKGAEENDPTRFREARAKLEAARLELYVPPQVDRLSSVLDEAERLDTALERASSSAGVGSKKELTALYTLIHRAHELRNELACMRISAVWFEAEQLRQLLGGYKPSSLALAASRPDMRYLRTWLESKRKDCVSELLRSELRTPRPLGLKESVQLRTARLVLDVRTAMEENDLVGLREALEDDKAIADEQGRKPLPLCEREGAALYKELSETVEPKENDFVRAIEDTRPFLKADGLTWSQDKVQLLFEAPSGRDSLATALKMVNRLPKNTKQGKASLKQVDVIQEVRSTLLKCDVNQPQSFETLATLLKDAERFAAGGELAFAEIRCAGEELLSIALKHLCDSTNGRTRSGSSGGGRMGGDGGGDGSRTGDLAAPAPPPLTKTPSSRNQSLSRLLPLGLTKMQSFRLPTSRTPRADSRRSRASKGGARSLGDEAKTEIVRKLSESSKRILEERLLEKHPSSAIKDIKHMKELLENLKHCRQVSRQEASSTQLMRESEAALEHRTLEATRQLRDKLDAADWKARLVAGRGEDQPSHKLEECLPLRLLRVDLQLLKGFLSTYLHSEWAVEAKDVVTRAEHVIALLSALQSCSRYNEKSWSALKSAVQLAEEQGARLLPEVQALKAELALLEQAVKDQDRVKQMVQEHVAKLHQSFDAFDKLPRDQPDFVDSWYYERTTLGDLISAFRPSMAAEYPLRPPEVREILRACECAHRLQEELHRCSWKKGTGWEGLEQLLDDPDTQSKYGGNHHAQGFLQQARSELTHMRETEGKVTRLAATIKDALDASHGHDSGAWVSKISKALDEKQSAGSQISKELSGTFKSLEDLEKLRKTYSTPEVDSIAKCAAIARELTDKLMRCSADPEHLDFDDTWLPLYELCRTSRDEGNETPAVKACWETLVQMPVRVEEWLKTIIEFGFQGDDKSLVAMQHDVMVMKQAVKTLGRFPGETTAAGRKLVARVELIDQVTQALLVEDAPKVLRLFAQSGGMLEHEYVAHQARLFLCSQAKHILQDMEGRDGKVQKSLEKLLEMQGVLPLELENLLRDVKKLHTLSETLKQHFIALEKMPRDQPEDVKRTTLGDLISAFRPSMAAEYPLRPPEVREILRACECAHRLQEELHRCSWKKGTGWEGLEQLLDDPDTQSKYGGNHHAQGFLQQARSELTHMRETEGKVTRLAATIKDALDASHGHDSGAWVSKISKALDEKQSAGSQISKELSGTFKSLEDLEKLRKTYSTPEVDSIAKCAAIARELTDKLMRCSADPEHLDFDDFNDTWLPLYELCRARRDEGYETPAVKACWETCNRICRSVEEWLKTIIESGADKSSQAMKDDVMVMKRAVKTLGRFPGEMTAAGRKLVARVELIDPLTQALLNKDATKVLQLFVQSGGKLQDEYGAHQARLFMCSQAKHILQDMQTHLEQGRDGKVQKSLVKLLEMQVVLPLKLDDLESDLKDLRTMGETLKEPIPQLSMLPWKRTLKKREERDAALKRREKARKRLQEVYSDANGVYTKLMMLEKEFVELQELEGRSKKHKALSAIPSYWQSTADPQTNKSGGDPFSVVPLQRSEPEWKVLQEMLKADAQKLGFGADFKEKSGNYNKLEVAQVWRIEHPSLWSIYVSSRQQVAQEMQRIRAAGKKANTGMPLATLQLARKLPGGVYEDANENFLMHGCAPGVLVSILGNGLNERFAGASAGTAYGEGVYLAEDAGKCDQYVRVDDKLQSSGELEELHKRLYKKVPHPGTVYYIFVCRAAIGHHVSTIQMGKTANCEHGKPVFPVSFRELAPVPGTTIFHHSLLADVLKVKARFREIIVFHSNYIYPEYVIAYKRTG